MIKHVFIDMDGVISDWLSAACKTLGLDVKDPEIRQKTKDGIWLDQMGFFTEDEMWTAIIAEGTDWWANLDIYPWATTLINKMKEFGDIHFLTSPGLCEMAPTGKMQWIMRYFGKEYLKQVISTKHKYICAAPDRILIDDSERRLQEFTDENGHSFLWPCPFSIEDGDIPIEDVMESLTNVIDIINKGKGHGAEPGGIWRPLCRHEDGSMIIARKDTPKPDPKPVHSPYSPHRQVGNRGYLSGNMMTWDALTKKDE